LRVTPAEPREGRNPEFRGEKGWKRTRPRRRAPVGGRPRTPCFPSPHRLSASQEESKSGAAMSPGPAPRRASSSRAASCSTHLRRMVTTRQAGRQAGGEREPRCPPRIASPAATSSSRNETRTCASAAAPPALSVPCLAANPPRPNSI
jgi:hypothetical protein